MVEPHLTPKTIYVENSPEVDWKHMKTLRALFEKEFKFDTVIVDCWINQQETIEAIKQADEIYCDTAFIGNPFTGGDTPMNNLMHIAISEGIQGKSLFIFRAKDRVMWHHLNEKLVEQCFGKMGNKIYCIGEKVSPEEVLYTWEEVTVEHMLKA